MHDDLLIEPGQVWVSKARPDRLIEITEYSARYDDVIYHVVGMKKRHAILGYNLRSQYRLNFKVPADEGHTFKISYESRMSSKVEGEEHFSDAPAFDGIVHTVEVRAWNLPDALRKAAGLPFSVLMNEDTTG